MAINISDDGSIDDSSTNWRDLVREDFETMHGFLSMIQDLINTADPTIQRRFYLPIREIIYEAYRDAKQFYNNESAGKDADLMNAFGENKDDEL